MGLILIFRNEGKYLVNPFDWKYFGHWPNITLTVLAWHQLGHHISFKSFPSKQSFALCWSRCRMWKIVRTFYSFLFISKKIVWYLTSSSEYDCVQIIFMYLSSLYLVSRTVSQCRLVYEQSKNILLKVNMDNVVSALVRNRKIFLTFVLLIIRLLLCYCFVAMTSCSSLPRRE